MSLYLLATDDLSFVGDKGVVLVLLLTVSIRELHSYFFEPPIKVFELESESGLIACDFEFIDASLVFTTVTLYDFGAVDVDETDKLCC
mmetsp:Transcript_21092/g.23612  ORF Transcript_21092/g.23612 Transcript_21092/m.23612 type:complete len:88 (+) Transcript_21092:3325-3588(+)